MSMQKFTAKRLIVPDEKLMIMIHQKKITPKRFARYMDLTDVRQNDGKGSAGFRRPVPGTELFHNGRDPTSLSRPAEAV